ncbi:hypothetical protein ACL00X_14065 [Aeromonas diversa]|uniref:hypothetical protein n=1 Tax=Aeromonas diversa TaxID=502790 RepID=UPI0039A370CF
MNIDEFKALPKNQQAKIIENQVKRKYFKSKRLYGIGLCDIDFPVSMRFEGGVTVYHPAYTCWQNMLKRCFYNRNTTKYNPATVCEAWLHFSNFLVWWKWNYIDGFELDKDFGSFVMFGTHEQKLYSPETCQFIPKWMNLIHRTKHGKVMKIKQAV